MDNNYITWSVELERHPFGTFSSAYKQVHPLRRKDFVRIDTGSNFVFVGLSHVNGISEEASCFLCEHYVENLKVYAKDSGVFSDKYLDNALRDTECEFNDRKTSPIDIGAGFLALVFDGVDVHVLSAGDSRALVVEEALIEQLTTIQNRPCCPQLFEQGIVVGIPQHHKKRLTVSNRCMIVGSSGLWKVLRNEEVVHIVQSNPPDGIATRLIQHALGRQPLLQDDITVAVIFLDHELLDQHFTFPNLKVQFYSSYLPPATQEEDLGRMIKSRDLKRHPYGELSAAAIEAHEIMKTYCNLKIGSDGLFFGIFDGGHSEKASHFLANNLYRTLKGIVGDTKSIGIDSLRRALIETGEDFFRYATGDTDSSCLAGVIMNRSLYLANNGSSRAVLACLDESGSLVAVQLTTNQIANDYATQWNGLLASEPEMKEMILETTNKFFILASEGFWKEMENEEAVDIVKNNPRAGIARRLIISALKEAARKNDLSFHDNKYIPKRTYLRDDMVVIVVYLDLEETVESSTSNADETGSGMMSMWELFFRN